MSTGGTYSNNFVLSPQKSCTNKGIQVATTILGPAKDQVILKIEQAISSYKQELDEIRQKYDSDISQSSDHILNLQKLNETLTKANRDKDRLILQFENNISLMEEQINDLTKERNGWKQEINFFKTNEYNKIDSLRKTLENTDLNELQIKEIKDKIFSFLINERNKGADKFRVQFYNSIINLLMLASDTEKDSSFDLKSLMNHFTNEGRKHFGESYVFHNFNKDNYDSNFDPDFENNFNQSVRKHNKSETRLATSTQEFNRIGSHNSTNILGSDDVSCLTDIGSNHSKKRKKRKIKKKNMLESKVKELSDAIEKQKDEVQRLQEKMKQDSFASPEGQQKIRGLSSIEKVNRSRSGKPMISPINQANTQNNNDTNQFYDINEYLLQYNHMLSKIVEDNIEQRRNTKRSTL
jgi:hypothetical protein